MLNPAPNPYPHRINQPKGKQDIMWLTDIEKIQAEIARDLEMTQPQPSPVEGSISASAPEGWLPATTDTLNTTDALTRAPFSPANPAKVGFYQEAIKEKPRKERSWAKIIAVILLVCTFGMGSLGFGLGAAFTWFTSQEESTQPQYQLTDTETPTITSNQFIFEAGDQQSGTIADMVSLLESAVVSITTIFDEGNQGNQGNRGVLPSHDSIAGSGTIFAESDDRIFIVTGSYVVPAGADSHQVRISGSKPLEARFVNNNRESGLAVISVDKALLFEAGIEAFTIATFGDSSQMQVGNTVFAIGNARNEGISVTRGIISAAKQELAFPGYTLTVLQTDAAINYGSSGGPLINLNGEVIGINIDRATVMFGNAAIEGIGYSIASNEVVPTLNELINPTTPGLGIIGQTVNEELADALGIPAMGVLVVGVSPGGSAYMAGIQVGDIITSFGGEPVFVMEGLQYAIRQRQIGDIAEVRILREGGTALTLEVVLHALVPQ